MVKIISLNCRNCGGSLNKQNKCEYCGTEHIILHDKVEKKFENGGAIFSCGVTGATGHNKPFTFEVENINGKIKIKPDEHSVNRDIGLIRIKGDIPSLKFKDYVILFHQFQSQFQSDFSDATVSLFIYNINDFDFSGLKKDSKIEVSLFPTYSIKAGL